MKISKKKIASVALANTVLMSSFACYKTNAITVTWGQTLLTVAAQFLVPITTKLFDWFFRSATEFTDDIADELEKNNYGGFRPLPEIIKKLKKIISNTSRRKIYGQEKAKKQLFDSLSSIAVRIHNTVENKISSRDLRGNIVYIRGNSGTGKTEMCYEIARAFLKHQEKSCVFLHSESITSESELGTQLFKLISTADIGKRRFKNIFTGTDGVIPKNEESPMLKHVLKWVDTVIIIDEYDKMKLKSAKPGAFMNIGGTMVPNPNAVNLPQVDNSADEIFRSIASTGRYKFMNKEVDCSRTLFLITTNETREEIENNFGIGGVQGGGAQRINIIDFEDLSLEACRGITNDLVSNMNNILTDPEGPFKFEDFIISEESKELMSKYIFDDKIMQGRSKFKLEDKIYGLFSRTIGEEIGYTIELNFVYDEKNHEGYFAKKIISVPKIDNISNLKIKR